MKRLPRPYRIDVPDDGLADLRDRLGRTRWPEQMPGAGWDSARISKLFRAYR
jgi:hypothetical protein